jgi:hypothetical protein
MLTMANGTRDYGVNMIGKKWKLTDTDGNPPDEKELKQLIRWLSHDDSRPKVFFKRSEDECVLSFEKTEGRQTFAHLAGEYRRNHEFMQKVKAAAEQRDYGLVRLLFKLGD